MIRSIVPHASFALYCALLPFAAQAGGPAVTIEITKFAFSPQDITVPLGTTVRWVNHDETPHTVASAPGTDKLIASKALDTDDHYEVTPNKVGDYKYFCTVHPFMTGIIHIRNP